MAACAGLVLLTASPVAFPSARTSALRAAGHALVLDDPVERADVLVVTVDAGVAGLLEAADLVQRGVATRVALLGEAPDPADREFLRRFPSYEDATARNARQLGSLGVELVERVPATVAGSTDEARVLAEWSRSRRFRSLVIVCSRDHSRRLHRAFSRVIDSNETKIMIRAARLSEFDPDTWWHTRAGARTEIIELQKLVLDFALHPLS